MKYSRTAGEDGDILEWNKAQESVYDQVLDLMDDGTSMQYRFMNGRECAAWITSNRTHLHTILHNSFDQSGA